MSLIETILKPLACNALNAVSLPEPGPFISTDKTFDEDTRIRLSYNILNKASKFRFFKPCVKRYLVNRVRSRFVKINADQWDTALFLPTERFRKKSKSAVYKLSRKMIS